jgi:hypothetical protein
VRFDKKRERYLTEPRIRGSVTNAVLNSRTKLVFGKSYSRGLNRLDTSNNLACPNGRSSTRSDLCKKHEAPHQRALSACHGSRLSTLPQVHQHAEDTSFPQRLCEKEISGHAITAAACSLQELDFRPDPSKPPATD